MTKNRTPTPVYLDPGMHSGLEVKGLRALLGRNSLTWKQNLYTRMLTRLDLQSPFSNTDTFFFNFMNVLDTSHEVSIIF